MKRPQLDYADWHVTARGARRLLLFHDDADFATFYALLGESCRDSGMGLIADCLMSNHFHLSLSGGTKSLTRCMQRLNRAYSGYHNERYDLSGHAFEQAYYAEPIPSDFILKRVVRYIHLNPVRGGRVSTPERYPWSSYRRLSSAQPDSLGNEELRLLHLFDPDEKTAQNAYKAFTSKDMHRQYVPAMGRTPAWEIWQEQFTWILDHAMENDAILDPIDPEAVAVYLGSQVGIPPRAMGKVLNHPDGRQVSTMLRSIRRHLEGNPAANAKIKLLRIL
jgi:REP element-mobilizing transposase RayT